MDLFSALLDEPINILPHDGVVHYYGEIMPLSDSEHYFQRLLSTIDWRCDQALVLGKIIATKRKVAWCADTLNGKPFSYSYSGVTKQSLPFTDELRALKKLVEHHSNASYNSCLLNLYHSGEEGMAWHSDGETELAKQGAIASLSFGVERKFAFKHKESKQVVALSLKPGSLLVMKGATQQHWLHRLPPTKKVSEPRINLTFRTIDKPEVS
ncbi:alpha-ketoglutarate-dependent dioxygenase AlkB family protein [Colwellia ponticola]|uniref:Alpha-ketoglutarate-dependent dioxygenase AlkB n=1 Tax=Colwellia ponticola TaxID=2304625 RepID=A0A8H2JNW8_9GAMM|nr:alpha-ketoglutarate-dependent dioxygenase AlkB [Colwellia ponticola]TMM47541.1 alpha-ketoglutarate-dependent dioxygenase AlkB [Colwellia ponticola]